MAKIIVTTAKGKQLNMSALKAKNQSTIPLGNKTARAKKQELDLRQQAEQHATAPPRMHSMIPTKAPVGLLHEEKTPTSAAQLQKSSKVRKD